MAEVVAPSSLPSASHDIGGGAPKTGKSILIRRKTPSELRAEQLKRSNDLKLLDESPSAAFASNNALGNGFKKPGLLRNPRYIDTRMDEVFQVKKSRLRILSGKDNPKENSPMEQTSSFMNISLLSNSNTSQCKGNSVGHADVALDKTVKSSQTVENSSQSVFRSVTELSSGGDKLTGLTSIDMGKALKGLFARETTSVSSLPPDSSKRFNNASSTYPSDLCGEICILGQKAPLDFTLKTSMRVVSSSSLSWIHKIIVSASMPQFSIQDGSQDQVRNCGGDLPPASQASGPLILHSWVYPQSTLPSSLVSVLNSSGTVEAEFLSRRQQAWEDSFQSLYYMLRNNICRVFYVCTSQFVVMFTSGDASGGNKHMCNAYISQSTRGLRSILSENGVCFSMPLCRSKVEQVNAEVLVELSEIEKYNLGQVKFKEMRSANCIAAVPKGRTSKDGDSTSPSSVGVSYSLEISDAYIPPWVVSSVCAVMAMGSKGKSFEASFTTDAISTGLNVALGSVDADESNSPAKAIEGLKPINHVFGIPEVIASLSLRAGFLRSLKYSDGSFTASLSPA